MRKKAKQPKQPPIYRASERLLSWSVPIVDSMPKSLASQTLVGLLISDLRDCLTAVLIGHDAVDLSAKIQSIKLLIGNLTAVRTTMRIFTENRYISLKQEMEFLDLVNPIQVQALAWLNKWEQAVAESSNIHG